jgi:hypothetical protein
MITLLTIEDVVHLIKKVGTESKIIIAGGIIEERKYINFFVTPIGLNPNCLDGYIKTRVSKEDSVKEVFENMVKEIRAKFDNIDISYDIKLKNGIQVNG